MRIRYLLLHAYGTGGTIRTVFNQANAMVALGHQVEIVSVLRGRHEPRFPLDRRVPITALVDERPDAEAPPAQRAQPQRARQHGPLPHNPLVRTRARRSARLLEKSPRYVPQGEFGYHYFSRHVENAVIGYLRTLRDGILVSTRPALNLLAARFATAGTVRVAQEHMNLATHRGDVRSAIARWYGCFDLVTVLTHRDREDYQELLPGSRVVCVPNAVHSTRQKPSTCTRKIAVAVGRLYPQKGFDLLIPAFAKAVADRPDWQLRIFGKGERWAQLRALIEEHHMYNHILLMGHTQQLDDELAKASMFVLSSRFEGLPMAMIEAMTHALPVVGFDCPTGPADVVTHGKEGLLVPPLDTDGLAEAMGQLMDDEGLRAEMGDAALITSHGYAPEAVHPQWEALFAELQPS